LWKNISPSSEEKNKLGAEKMVEQMGASQNGGTDGVPQNGAVFKPRGVGTAEERLSSLRRPFSKLRGNRGNNGSE
jgi:hypothetical protein